MCKMAVGKIKAEKALDIIGEDEGILDWKQSASRLLNGLVKGDDQEMEREYHRRVRWLEEMTH